MDLSLIIPTRDRRDRVLATLDALAAQDRSGIATETIVVDNGSGDGTFEALRARDDVVALQEPTPGASAARNAGIRVARGEVVLLLGDDMVPAGDDLLARHAALHRERSEDGYAVLGRICWAPPVTPFMRYLETAGLQFSFDFLRPGPVDPSKYLYSSHASLKRSLLLQHGGFDERFPFLGEDTELGIRLGRAGVELDYHPDLVVEHHHRQDLPGFEARMRVNGAVARRTHDLHPGEAPQELVRPNWKWAVYPFAAPVGRALLRAGVRGRLRERAWSAILMRSYVRGWRG